MSDTILAPLTPFDQSWLERHGLTKGYIVKNVDIQALKAAAIRVVDKWRVLAGHLQWSKKLSSWCIQVPLQGDISHRIKFTTRKLATHLGPPFMIGSSSTVLTRPPLKYFRDSSVPHDLRSFASSKAPFISIHVTEFLNCACVGISFTHGILDAFAFGLFMNGLTHELKGIPWEAPPVSETNPLRVALKDLESIPPMYDPNDPAMIRGLRRTFVPYTMRNNMTFEGSIAYQEIFHHLEDKMLYLRGKGLETLLREAKDEIKRSGCNEPVSEGDILAMWVLKAGVGVFVYTGNILNTQ
ncbi:hypothetical protein H0H93_009460 [Arthromyces matolae]|nr:hypothetical protein H0H93_009460 [Arthromyces matolae]